MHYLTFGPIDMWGQLSDVIDLRSLSVLWAYLAESSQCLLNRKNCIDQPNFGAKII